MKCVIMAGGFGTRLRPLTNNLPKPMVPMANRPIIDHIIDLLKKYSIKDIAALLYHQPEVMIAHLGGGKKFDVKIDCITATVDLGTAGAVAAAMRRWKGKETTLVISGDVLTDINIAEAVKFHKKMKSMATLVLTRVENPLSFGVVITNKRGRITRFLEKPGWGEVFSDTINTGIYILEKEVLDYLPEGEEMDFGKDLYPMLLKKKEPMYGYVADGYWKDVGTLEEYRQANMDILQGLVNVDMPGEKADSGDIWVGAGSRIDFSTSMEGSVVIGEGCKIESGAKIVNSIIGPRSTVVEDSVVIDSVLWENVKVARGAQLQENIVGRNTIVAEGAHLFENVIVSDDCYVGRNSTVKANVKIWPSKVVEDGAVLASSLIWGQKWTKNIFSTYGVTGLANVELSPEFAAKMGAAFGASVPKGSCISTSRDTHKTSRMINRAVMTGILSTGVDVHDYGVIPMPVCRLLAKGGVAAGGIHTRRSPFDPLVLDMKFFDDKGMDLHPGYEKTVERLFHREDFRRVPMDETGEVIFPIHGLDYYQDGFMSAIDAEVVKKAKFKIVLDYSYGSSSRVFPAILGRLDCEVIAVNANLDGTKTTLTAGQFSKATTQLSSIVKSVGADMGFLLDAGGEKVFMVDDLGEVIDGDTALNIVALLTLKCAKAAKKKGTIAVPVTASRAVDFIARNYNFDVLRTKTTTRGLMEAAGEEKVAFVGEASGGYIFPQFQPNFDGMYAIAKILEMLAMCDVKFRKLIRELPPSIILKDQVPCPFEHKGLVMRRLAEDSNSRNTTLLDGIRIDFKSDWVAAYPSQDSPYFHIVAEAPTEHGAKSLISKYAEKIRTWQK